MCTLVADDRVGLVFKTKGAVSVYRVDDENKRNRRIEKQKDMVKTRRDIQPNVQNFHLGLACTERNK
jgi:hypothetical protein